MSTCKGKDAHEYSDLYSIKRDVVIRRQQSDVLKLQWEMELLQVQLVDLKEKLSEVENEGDIYWRANFQLTKLKMMSLRFYFILDSQTMEHS